MNAGRDGSIVLGLLAVGVGAVLGAWLRWGLGYWLNPNNPQLPYGTLVANLIGGFFIGIAVGAFALFPSVSPFWRLLIVTGFLGALTTFSTFSAENVALLGSGAWSAALLHAGLHLLGSLLATAAGIATARALL